MMASIRYDGHLRCTCTHLQSGSIIETDAPTDNKGKGERFSPTDSLCVSLATCIITTMAIKAESIGIELAGSSLEVYKHMLIEPRRIGKIEINIHLQATDLDADKKKILEAAGNGCPVKRSLHPDLETIITYHWK